MKLDRTRNFGTFKGEPYQPEGCDRVVVYQQDGRLFDVSDREIVPGQTLAQAREQRRQYSQIRAEAAAELLAEADKLPPALLKSLATIVLATKKCPSKKADIIAAIKEMLARSKASADDEEGPDRTDRTVPAPGKAPEPTGHKGMSFARRRQQRPAAKPPPVKSAPPPSPQGRNGANVDLAAWARGHKDYPFSELRKAVETQLSIVATEPRAALEALIDKGVVPFEEARDDLLPHSVEVEDHQDA